MTPCDLVWRDYKKAELNLANALNKPNVTEAEIERLEELLVLRKQICEIVHKNIKGE